MKAVISFTISVFYREVKPSMFFLKDMMLFIPSYVTDLWAVISCAMMKLVWKFKFLTFGIWFVFFPFFYFQLNMELNGLQIIAFVFSFVQSIPTFPERQLYKLYKNKQDENVSLTNYISEPHAVLAACCN